MHRNVVAFVLITLVVVGTVGAFNLESTTGGGIGSLASACTTSVQDTNGNRPNGTLVTSAYQMNPGTTAVVCIEYVFLKSTIFMPQTTPLLCGPYRGSNGSIVWTCPGLVAVATRTLPFDASKGESISVAYSLRAPSSDNGVYWFWIDCGEVFPVVVGALPRSLVFPIIAGCVYEHNTPSSGSVAGVSNMKVALVPVG